MPTRVLLAIDSSLSPELVANCRDLCSTFASVIGMPVLLASLESETLDDLRAWTYLKTEGVGLDGFEPAPAVSSAPMAAAEFIYRDDGRREGGAQGATVCELAV